MAYTFIGYQTVSQAGASSITVDFSTLTGGTIAPGDSAYVTVVSSMGTSTSHAFSSTGWVNMGTLVRNPASTATTQACTLSKSLVGSETTVTFTDGNARGDTVLALVVVYRNLATVAFTTQIDPGTTNTVSSPWTETNPTDVTATIGTTTNAVGVVPQMLLYIYLDMRNSSAIVRSSVDAALTERVSYTDTSNAFFVMVLDEQWASASNLPSRAISTHWTTGTGSHSGAMVRYAPSSNQSIAEEGQDAWAWVG